MSGARGCHAGLAAIAERAWQLFRVPATVAETLILGDVPVLKVQFPASDGRDYPLLAFPLDPRTLLVLYPFNGEDEPDAELTADDVGAVNRVTWRHAQHAAVGRHGTSRSLNVDLINGLRVTRSNLFLIPLDDQRRWYRYHHLFADVLRPRAYALRGLHVRGPAIDPHDRSVWESSQG